MQVRITYLHLFLLHLLQEEPLLLLLLVHPLAVQVRGLRGPLLPVALPSRRDCPRHWAPVHHHLPGKGRPLLLALRLQRLRLQVLPVARVLPRRRASPPLLSVLLEVPGLQSYLYFSEHHFKVPLGKEKLEEISLTPRLGRRIVYLFIVGFRVIWRVVSLHLPRCQTNR